MELTDQRIKASVRVRQAVNAVPLRTLFTTKQIREATALPYLGVAQYHLERLAHAKVIRKSKRGRMTFWRRNARSKR